MRPLSPFFNAAGQAAATADRLPASDVERIVAGRCRHDRRMPPRPPNVERPDAFRIFLVLRLLDRLFFERRFMFSPPFEIEFIPVESVVVDRPFGLEEVVSFLGPLACDGVELPDFPCGSFEGWTLI